MKKTIVIIIVLLIVGVLFWVFKSKTNAPAINTDTNINLGTTKQSAAVAETEITTINKDIESIDVGNSDQEFKDVNTDLKGL